MAHPQHLPPIPPYPNGHHDPMNPMMAFPGPPHYSQQPPPLAPQHQIQSSHPQMQQPPQMPPQLQQYSQPPMQGQVQPLASMPVQPPTQPPPPQTYALQVSQHRAIHPPLMTFSHSQDGRTYSLEVPQQPVRARMCGFGDKDRRPITPPPCVRLIIRDSQTNEPININDIEPMYFVLTVDLWNETGEEEVNLIKNQHDQSNKAQISLSQPSSFPPHLGNVMTFPSERGPGAPHMAIEGMPTSTALAYQPPMGAGGQYDYKPQMVQTHAGPMQLQGPPQQQPPAPHYVPQMQIQHPPAALASNAQPAANMYTRNLIGSLSVNATKLKDTENVEGVWFVLQDLSVRTEGRFRLKLAFMDIRQPGEPNGLNRGRARILATQFSEPFDVFSAKKFPGVIESTPLSKAFATQGIKIPIRKDGPRDRDDQADYDADEV